MHIDNIYIDYSLRIFASFVCGVLLGVERKSKQHSVGLRTLVLISVSSSLLTIISAAPTFSREFLNGDPTRVVAGVVTGIGFLGAGAILHQGINIRGLTSAAIIWTACALGIACGAGQYFLAGITFFVVLVSLIVLAKIESRFYPAEKSKKLIIMYSGQGIDVQNVKNEIISAGLVFRDVNIEESIEKERTVLKFLVKSPKNFNLDELLKKLSNTGKITKISISEE